MRAPCYLSCQPRQAPWTHRGRFSIHRAVFALWNAPVQRFGLAAFRAQHRPRQTPLVVLEPVLQICPLREARWRCLAVRDGTSRLDCASHLDVMSLAANIFAPFGAVARISRTARRMAHDILCAALLLSGCLRLARVARLAIAALVTYAALRTSASCSTPPPRSHQRPYGVVRDRAGLFEQPVAGPTRPESEAGRSSQVSRARGLFMLVVGHNNRPGRPRCRVLSFVCSSGDCPSCPPPHLAKPRPFLYSPRNEMFVVLTKLFM